MMVYIFTPAKRVRKIIPTSGVTDLVHDEADNTLYATVGMEYGVSNGEHLGFMCVDGRFRLFTVTKAENFDDNHTTIITGKDAIVLELMEMIVEEKQQLDVQLIPAIEGLLAAAGTTDAWSVTGAQPSRVEKSRAYYTDMWRMLETFRVLYEWQIIPYYTFSGGQISGRVIELKADVAEFRGRILTSKKDASNVYVIKSNPPITRLYVLGKATGTEDEPKNENIRDVSWSIASGNPANKPKGQAWIEDASAVSKYGVHTNVVVINDAEDEKNLIEKGWKHLQTVKEPRSTVEATVQDLERVEGYENQIIRLGDLVPIRLTNATMEAARVINVKRDYIRPSLTKVIIGDKEATIQSQVSSLMTNAAHTFERLTIFKNRFHEDEALIQLNAEMIQMNADIIEMNAREIRANAELIDLKAGKEEVTELGTRISAAEILIDGINAEIDLKASRAELSDIESRLSTAEIRISGAEAKIELKAEQTTVTALEQRLSQAEIDIDGANAQITMKASQSDVDALGERLSQAEIDIDGANAQINLKASKSVVDELGERVTSAELLIDGQNSRIEAKADLILLEGYVKADELETETLKVVDGATLASLKTGAFNCSGIATVSTLYVGTGAVIPSLVVGGEQLSASTLSMGSVANSTVFGPSDINLSHSHAVTVDGGTVTLGEVSSTGGSFNIADTQFYKNGVSAAKESVTLTSLGWTNGRNLVQASNGKALYVSLPAFSVSGGDSFVSNKTTVYFSTPSVNGYLASKTVDASSVYTSGYNSAKVQDLTIGSPTYYDSSKTYTFHVTAIAADGSTTQEYFGLNAQAAYDAGYAAGEAAGGSSTPDIMLVWTVGDGENEYIVMAVDKNTGAVLATTTNDFTSIYNKGWNACRDACTRATSVYTIKEYAPGTLYLQVNGNYTSVGSDWVRTTPAVVYNRPAAKS